MKKILVALLFCSQGFAASYSVTRVSGTHTVGSGEELLLCSGQSYVVTLPACSGTNDGETHVFKNTDSDPNGTVEIDPNGTDMIDSASSFFFSPGQSATFSCDGTANTWRGVAVY